MKRIFVLFCMWAIISVSPVALAITYWNDGQSHVINNSIYQDDMVWLDYGVTRVPGTHVDIVAGGVVGNLNAYRNATVTMTGGTVLWGLEAFENASITMTNGTVFNALAANTNSSITVSGGVVEKLYANDNATVNLLGGVIDQGMFQGLFTQTNGVIYLNGSNFQVNGHNLSEGDRLSDFGTLVEERFEGLVMDNYTGVISGTLTDGSVLNSHFYIYNTGYCQGTGDIIIVPEPATVSLLALGGLALLRKRK